MPIKVTNVNDGLKIKIDSDYNTTSLFSGSKKRYITLNTGSTISIATQDTYGVVRGSDSIIIENGRVKIAPSVLENILEGAATQEWVLSQDYASKTYLNQVLEAYPTSADLDDILVPYATKEWVEDNFPADVSGYATKSWVENSATAYNAARLGGYLAADYPRKAENAVITGAWTINNDLTVSGSLTAGGSVGTGNFISQMQGWRVTPQGQADFRHIYTDELQAKAFTADISQALVGSDVLTKSVAKLAQNWATTANGVTSTIYVEELEGFPGFQVFAVGDRLLLRLFDRSGGGLLIKNIWATVASYVGTTDNVQSYTITVNSGGVTGQMVYAGSMILDYGTPGSGVIERTVLDQQGSPYSRVSTWMISPDNPENYTLHYQSGNLNGIANAEGWGMYSENSFLTGKLLVGDLTKAGQYMEYKDGELNIKGKITVTGGNAATKADVDSLQIGGRNLILNSSFAREYDNWGTTGGSGHTIATGASDYPSTSSVKRSAKWTNTADAGQGIAALTTDSWPLLENGKEYVITCWVKASSAGTFSLHAYGDSGDVVDSFKAFSVNTDWQKIVHIITGDGQSNPRVCFFGRNNGVTYWVNCPKVELGNKATDWSPAPEDVDAAIDSIEVGGRNLFEKTNQGITNNLLIDSSAGGATWTLSEEIVDGVRCVKGTKNTAAAETWVLFNIRSYTPWKYRANQQYAISFKMKPSFAINNQITRLSTNTNQALSTNSGTYSLVAGEWNHIKLVVTTLPDFDTILAGRTSVHLRLNIIGNSSTGDTVLLKDIKIEEGNKATDWTPAPEDISSEINVAKQEALNAASNAQTSADTANTAVGNLSGYVDGAFKDGVIDTAEAKAIEKYINSINEIMSKTEASYNKVYANTYLEGTAKTNLLNAKVNLYGKRDSLLSAINTAILDGKTTAAEKAVVDTAFANFNTDMASFTNALEEANKAIQVKLDDIAKGYVNDLEIGGRNYLKDSAKFGASWVPSGGSFITIEPSDEAGVNQVKHTGSAYLGQATSVIGFDFSDTAQTFTISVYAKAQTSGTIGLTLSGSQVNYMPKPLTQEWAKYVWTFSGIGSTLQNFRFYISGASTENPIYIKKPSIFLGSKATDWTPAPEDVPSALDYLATAIQDGTTEIEGGLINTNVLMVKDTNGAVRGGISGLASDNVGFWTGGTYQAAVDNNANVIFRKDGSFSLAGGKISGTSAGALSVDGSVVTGIIESSNYDGIVGSRFDLHNGHLLIGDAIRMSGDVSEIQVRNRDTGLDSFRIGDFPLTPIDFVGAGDGVDVFLSSSSVTASPASGSYQLNSTVYLSRIGELRTSTASIANELIVGGIYNFQTKLKVTLSSYDQLYTVMGMALDEKFRYRGGNGIKMQLKNGDTVVWEQNILTIPENGVIPLFISASFQAVNGLLRLIITIDGEYGYQVPDGINTRIYNTYASISRFDSSSKLVLQALVNRVQFSTKGMQVVFSSANYFRCDSTAIMARGTQIFISPNGMYRLRVSNTGIEKSTDYGNNWTTL